MFTQEEKVCLFDLLHRADDRLLYLWNNNEQTSMTHEEIDYEFDLIYSIRKKILADDAE